MYVDPLEKDRFCLRFDNTETGVDERVAVALAIREALPELLLAYKDNAYLGQATKEVIIPLARISRDVISGDQNLDIGKNNLANLKVAVEHFADEEHLRDALVGLSENRFSRPIHDKSFEDRIYYGAVAACILPDIEVAFEELGSNSSYDAAADALGARVENGGLSGSDGTDVASQLG